MAITDFYNDTVGIYRPSYTKDSIGGPVETLNLVESTACRVNDLSGKDMAYLGTEAEERGIKVFCTPSANVYEGDVMRVTYNGVQRDWSIRYVRKLHKKADFHHYELFSTVSVNQGDL